MSSTERVRVAKPLQPFLTMVAAAWAAVSMGQARAGEATQAARPPASIRAQQARMPTSSGAAVEIVSLVPTRFGRNDEVTATFQLSGGAELRAAQGLPVAVSLNDQKCEVLKQPEPGRVIFRLPARVALAGTYRLRISLGKFDGVPYDGFALVPRVPRIASFGPKQVKLGVGRLDVSLDQPPDPLGGTLQVALGGVALKLAGETPDAAGFVFVVPENVRTGDQELSVWQAGAEGQPLAGGIVQVVRLTALEWAVAASLAGAVVAALLGTWWLLRRRARAEKARVAPDVRSSGAPSEATGPEADGSPSKASSPASLPRGVFLSFSRGDEPLVSELIKHLRPVLGTRDPPLPLRTSSELENGSRSDRSLQQALRDSAIAVAVVSPEYLDSKQFGLLIEAQRRGGLDVLWLASRPSAAEATPLAEFQALFDPGRPLSLLDARERELALVAIVESMARILERGAEPRAGRDLAIGTSSPHRLCSIRLTNIRCFEELELDLGLKSPDGDQVPSLRTVLVGDNSTGKSTLLRAIALGLCDEAGATALLEKMPGSMVRTGASEGRIELRFRQDGSGKTSTCSTKISPATGTEVVRKSGNPLPPLLVAGYGTQRTRSGTESYEAYKLSTAVATLFDNDARLQNPELVLLRQPRWTRRGVESMLAGILGLQSGEVEYQREAIQIVGPWGRQRLAVLSDGYRSTAQWILDLVNWIAFAEAQSRPEELTGLVLIDELEQHLHPQWQRKILSGLRANLPRVQFIVTSHSPLIASSVTGLDESTKDGWREKLVYLEAREGGAVLPLEPEKPLRGLTVTQVLASPAFDYLVEAEPSVAATYEEASRLASKGARRTAQEEERYRKVKRIVGEILSMEDRTLIEREARDDLNAQRNAKIAELEKEVFGGRR